MTVMAQESANESWTEGGNSPLALEVDLQKKDSHETPWESKRSVLPFDKKTLQSAPTESRIRLAGSLGGGKALCIANS